MAELPHLFDPGPIIALQHLLGLGWPGPWRVISLLGIDWGILLVVGLSLWLWGRRTAYALLAIVVVEGVLKTLLNTLLPLSRPDPATGVTVYEQVEIGSFPSGHVSTTAALWVYLAVRQHVSWWIAGAVVGLVGLSRLYLGVHYVGDVVGGIVLGGLVVALMRKLWPPARDWLAARSFALYVGAAGLGMAGAVAGALFYFDNPYQWRAGGLVAGLAVALPLEYRYVRYHPAVASLGTRMRMALIGMAGIAACAAVDQLLTGRSPIIGLAATALAAVWALLIAPALFVRLRWSAPDAAPPAA